VLLPVPCGPLSEAVTTALHDGGQAVDVLPFHEAATQVPSPLSDADLQLALACCYELHYQGFEDVHDDREWDPDVLRLRAVLIDVFLGSVRGVVSNPTPQLTLMPVHDALRALVDAEEGDGSASSFLFRRADVNQWRDFLIQRSIYHLREADSHTFTIPRLHGAAKAAMVEIQTDEYGGGRLLRMHATLFAQTMRALGLEATYGNYWSKALPETLATVNLMSLFGLHRRWRGAAVGHLAALEMTSTGPNRRYGNGLRRLGYGSAATAFFDEHVEADAVHEQVAAVDLCGAFVAAEPALHRDVLWGASCCLALDAAAGAAMLRNWTAQPGLVGA